jgi:hypothetical protein
MKCLFSSHVCSFVLGQFVVLVALCPVTVCKCVTLASVLRILNCLSADARKKTVNTTDGANGCHQMNVMCEEMLPGFKGAVRIVDNRCKMLSSRTP